jgi:hypothetical protein
MRRGEMNRCADAFRECSAKGIVGFCGCRETARLVAQFSPKDHALTSITRLLAVWKRATKAKPSRVRFPFCHGYA